MKPAKFLDRLDDPKIVAAIAEAERKSSGEVRVYVSHMKRPDALGFARKRFAALGMDKTRHRNAVLVYLVPRTRQFAVVGDIGIHEKCGDGFWKEIAAAMTEFLKKEDYTTAVVEAIRRVGDELARHFPRDPDDRNELSNEIVRD